MPKRRAPSATVQAKMIENRVRAKADRYGLRLSRSRQRDGSLVGTYGVWNDQVQDWSFAGPDGWGWSLQACEAWLGRLAADYAAGANANGAALVGPQNPA